MALFDYRLIRDYFLMREIQKLLAIISSLIASFAFLEDHILIQRSVFSWQYTPKLKSRAVDLKNANNVLVQKPERGFPYSSDLVKVLYY